MLSDSYVDSYRVRDHSGFSAGSPRDNFNALALLGFMLFLFFIQADLALFAATFLVFVFLYNPTRVQIGKETVRDTHGLI